MADDKTSKLPAPIAASSGLETLDDFVHYTQPFAAGKRVVGNMLYGINHNRKMLIIPESRDDFGYVFFTRPQLNLSRSNIRNSRLFSNMLTKDPYSIHGYARNILDPRLNAVGEGHPLVDPLNVFIPVFSNAILKMSGWPDTVAPTMTSKEGVRKEQYSMIDGTTEINGTFDLDVTFRVFADEPVTQIMESWVRYPSLVFEGVFNPYLDYVVENTIDYNTRIYRLVMTDDGRYVKKIAATGASFPLNDQAGRSFDYTNETPYNDQNKEVTYRFRSMGAIYNDPKLVDAFNSAVGIFHGGMRNINKGLKTNMIKVPIDLIGISNFRGYPRINPSTYELEWYVTTAELAAYQTIGTLIEQ